MRWEGASLSASRTRGHSKWVAQKPTAPSTVAPVAVGRTLNDQQKEEKEKQACFLDRFPCLCGRKLAMDGSHPIDSK